MIYINEWLPNPSGSDSEGEWIELFNSGENQISLTGWFLVSKGGKEFSLSGKSIEAKGYLLLLRKETKLVLKNKDGAVALYGASGKLTDEARFLGSAPDGKSFARRLVRQSLDDGGSLSGGGFDFVFTEPTPGVANVFPQTAVVAKNFPIGEPLNFSLGAGEFFAMMLGATAVICGLIFYAVYKNENISKLFFGRN